MNESNDLFLLMVNLSRLHSKGKIIDLFVEGMQEIFKPSIFRYHDNKQRVTGEIVEVRTFNSQFGMISFEMPDKSDKINQALISNSIQMLAIILERLELDIQLKKERDALEVSAVANLQELEKSVQELEEARTASLNLIEELTAEIDKRKIAEEAIRESEEKFRNLFENSPVGKSMTGIDGSLNVNKAFCMMLGYSAQELRAKSWKDVSHPDDIALTNEYIRSLLAGESNSCRFEKRYIHRNGTIIYADVSTFLQRDKNGNPLYFITTINDNTDRKLAAEALAFNYNLLRVAGEIAKFGGWDVDLLENRSRWSDEVAAIHEMPAGYSPLVSEGISFYAPEWRNKITEVFTACAQEGIPYDEIMQIITSTGKRVWVRTIGKAIRDQSGKIVRVEGCFQDITAQKLAEQEILKLNEELEHRVVERTAQLQAANKELEAFSYSVSHDLRAPLRAIHSFTRILNEEYKTLLDDEGKRICGIIESSSLLMGKLIDDLLAFSRIGRIEPIHTAIDMNSMVASVFNAMTSPEERARISFKVSDLEKAYADSATIKQVWTNLISNALKYSSRQEKAEITIGCSVNPEEITYCIRDNGVGFDMQYSPKLFGVFQRLHSSKDFEGTGVGLAIVQRIVLRHGGRVWAVGEVGKGATFYFCLPNRNLKD